ncbi:MAG: hypothetical protein HZA14_08460, partial [Nitrospirae bacterium]|nr:hypothetical protein [Nitrospirota bacterium]
DPIEVPETVPAEPVPAPAPAVPEKEPEPSPQEPEPLPSKPDKPSQPEEEPEPAPPPEEEPAPSPQEPEPAPVEPDKELVPAGFLTPQFKALFEISERALPLRYFASFDNQFLVNLLSKLLGRHVYSEKAGIRPPSPESALDEELGLGEISATDAFYRRMDAQAEDSGHVLMDAGWIERLILKSPRALYILLSALDKFQARQGVQKPVVAVAGGEEIYERIRAALLRKDNRLNWEEKLEVKHFLEPSRLKELVEVVSPDEMGRFIQTNDYGVAVLISGSESPLAGRLGAQFMLALESVHDHDLVAVPFLIPVLLKAAQLIRGISDPEEQARLLESSIQNILPGAQRQGQAFIIQLAQYIEQVIIREHLVKVSA